MRKLLVLTSVLAILGAGNAFAFDASNGFRPSEQSDLTAPSFEVANPVDRTVAANVQGESGPHAVIARRVGWSAADGFGPTQRNDLTAPSFEVSNPVDGPVTASIKSKGGEQSSHAMAAKPAAWSAADGFSPTQRNDLTAPSFEVPSPVDGAVTASIKSKGGERGSHAMAVKRAAWSAADGFGPSRHNDLPAPRFEVAG